MNDFNWSELSLIESSLRAYYEQLRLSLQGGDLDAQDEAMATNDMTSVDILISKVKSIKDSKGGKTNR
jgi:hypothetical protein